MPVSRWCSRDFGELSQVAGTQPPGKAKVLPRPTPVAAPLRGAVFLEESSLAQNLSARKADATGQAAGALGPTFWQLSLQVQAPRCHRRTDRHRDSLLRTNPGDSHDNGRHALSAEPGSPMDSLIRNASACSRGMGERNEK